MSRLIEETGNRFGRLLVLGRHLTNTKWAYWLCICDCVKEKIVRSDHLRSNKIQSCGCLRLESIKESCTVHGHNRKGVRSPTYTSWREIFHRCCNPKYGTYHRYGGRGISFDPKWRSFEAFLEDMGERPPGHTLDRVNVDGMYTKDNCRWATKKEQARNTSANNRVLYEGREVLLIALAESLGVNPDSFWSLWKLRGRPETVDDIAEHYKRREQKRKER